ncbi:50S ribosomal protein L3 N(5)-glutamine methyltransferase [Thiolapillus brandeum]|uniref:Ribosomal protein uL3 glutamine methyltransferase n=1 Tax=Thiolapillus brandeum TaxID=1076588 RepID=A0A7U6GKH6_9GAMM|nr:50S ribosomal protein L3 N(5)-glutamine methyltransferase [Thiolapillus brandeum]BAO45331.1 adenine-specific DNA-methyltransferase [Thiolapillus brandeum]
MALNLSDTAELSTIRDWVRWGASRFTEAGLFFGHGTDNAFDESLALVLHALHLDHSLPGDFLDTRITASEGEQVLDYLRQRIEGHVPAAYITHEAHFAGLSFYVNENVLVPRSPIAELIEAGFSPWLPDADELDILDLCTGSGCIAIACSLYLPQARVDASDISPLALDVARVNMERHEVEDRVNLYRSDVFDDLPSREYDLIVSNPPYVSVEEMQGLPEEFRHEPALGLEAGQDGMDIVARILCQGSHFLKPGGIMIVEVGDSMGYLMERYPEVPFLWLDFERGGHGVFLLTAEQLMEYQDTFLEECES